MCCRAAGSGSATVTLNGGKLDMNGFVLGGSNAVTLALQSGTLKNVSQVNNGAGFSKTGSGTLTLDGMNTPTGPITITSGTLQVAPTGSLFVSGTVAGPGPIAVSGSGTLGGKGTVAANATINGNVAPRLGHARVHRRASLWARAAA